jgi:hypothetical protein
MKNENKEKREWSAPKVTDYGDVAEITLGGNNEGCSVCGCPPGQHCPHRCPGS